MPTWITCNNNNILLATRSREGFDTMIVRAEIGLMVEPGADAGGGGGSVVSGPPPPPPPRPLPLLYHVRRVHLTSALHLMHMATKRTSSILSYSPPKASALRAGGGTSPSRTLPLFNFHVGPPPPPPPPPFRIPVSAPGWNKRQCF